MNSRQTIKKVERHYEKCNEKTAWMKWLQRCGKLTGNSAALGGFVITNPSQWKCHRMIKTVEISE